MKRRNRSIRPLKYVGIRLTREQENLLFASVARLPHSAARKLLDWWIEETVEYKTQRERVARSYDDGRKFKQWERAGCPTERPSQHPLSILDYLNDQVCRLAEYWGIDSTPIHEYYHMLYQALVFDRSMMDQPEFEAVARRGVATVHHLDIALDVNREIQ